MQNEFGLIVLPPSAVSLNHDVDTDKELVAHGYSNLLAGFLGTVYVFSTPEKVTLRHTDPICQSELFGLRQHTLVSLSVTCQLRRSNIIGTDSIELVETAA